MADIKAPVFPESVQDGTIVEWHVAEGDQVARDQLLAEIETDKVVLEVVAPDDGVISSITKGVDSTVVSAEVIATFEAGATVAPKAESEELSKTKLTKAQPLTQPALPLLYSQKPKQKATLKTKALPCVKLPKKQA